MDRETNDRPPRMDADRLLGAADVLMEARARGRGAEAFVDAWLGNSGERAPSGEHLYTYDELVEGMCFLIRCGFVTPAQQGSQR